MNQIWVVDDNSDTRHKIEDGLRKRLEAPDRHVASAWSVTGQYENPQQAITAFNSMSEEKRKLVRVVVCDLYDPRRGSPVPDSNKSAQVEFKDTVVKAVKAIGEFQRSGVKAIIYTLVFGYCAEQKLTDVGDAVRSAIAVEGIDFASQVIDKTLQRDSDLEAIWKALQKQLPDLPCAS